MFSAIMRSDDKDTKKGRSSRSVEVSETRETIGEMRNEREVENVFCKRAQDFVNFRFQCIDSRIDTSDF